MDIAYILLKLKLMFVTEKDKHIPFILSSYSTLLILQAWLLLGVANKDSLLYDNEWQMVSVNQYTTSSLYLYYLLAAEQQQPPCIPQRMNELHMRLIVVSYPPNEKYIFTICIVGTYIVVVIA